MDETNKPTEIDYYTYEESMSRAERHTNRWRYAAIALFIALVVSNIVWVVYENSFEDVTVTENTQDGGGVNMIGGGDVNYGPEATDN